ncbi:triose-phosphate isomerase [Sulfitobacter mediterraneus]|uniref:triose-phosphate isomerase n=1 Tax=Sulfitobacter mediterraneus TaxID=83219 RepID=UPI001933351B|nr:triose-phosphate isomerase [Sulfitobacter mediterraneus]MBM1309711.1 triose-phosphate isomerase [Sulfitobacter mediterraneus]MBM1313596.1 triose-phosphate isomerase [Sulfitobacter mediterraneus]MBM1321980.1 triose-phosphate isomerase [Sulfitobacter mediterraneus]MBM1325867.1 triose-phosphate isomerase [Sulfitobacter mediterraneus]MBM1397213.1 triose-phosphate isomerase [Sulfitobacter mediterraneus]
MRRKIAAGNWKMNGTAAALNELETLAQMMPEAAPEVVICPPAPLLFRAVEATPEGIAIGGQDCHMQAKGAFTGDISAEMIADTGAGFVIVGHSERRDAHEETNSDIRAKTRCAWGSGLTAIVCIGESGDDRAANNTLDIIGGQLAGSLPDGADGANTVIAYEPIWAIGTGKVPTLEQIIEVHDFIRARLITRFGAEIGDAIALLYGGSVKPDNAEVIFRAENVDGALVGGASLKAADFAPIIAALAHS